MLQNYYIITATQQRTLKRILVHICAWKRLVSGSQGDKPQVQEVPVWRRRRLNERTCVFVPRRGQDAGRASLLHHFPPLYRHNHVANLGDDVQVVGDEPDADVSTVPDLFQ